MTPLILVVDDEPLLRWSLKEVLEKESLRVIDAGTRKEALAVLAHEDPATILLDVRLPDSTGIDLLREVRRTHPHVPVIMMTAYGTVDLAVEAMKAGAIHFVTKPFPMEALVLEVQKAIETNRLRERSNRHTDSRKTRYKAESFLGRSDAAQEIRRLARRIAASRAGTILLTGESGTGKDLLARILHFESLRAAEPFVPVNCGAIPENLVESELFGHEAGAFTDARRAKKGIVELAEGGTVYLDEVGEIHQSVQVRLLHFLENRVYRRVGGTVDMVVDARIVAATNRDLHGEVSEGRFRQDLFYRLNLIHIHLPSLRERREDVLLLAGHFLSEMAKKMRIPEKELSDEAADLMQEYPWPGNVRELRNAIERVMILETSRTISPEMLPIHDARHGEPDMPGGRAVVPRAPHAPVPLGEMEEKLIIVALERAGGNQTRAARSLGIGRNALRYRMKKLGLLDPSG